MPTLIPPELIILFIGKLEFLINKCYKYQGLSSFSFVFSALGKHLPLCFTFTVVCTIPGVAVSPQRLLSVIFIPLKTVLGTSLSCSLAPGYYMNSKSSRFLTIIKAHSSGNTIITGWQSSKHDFLSPYLHWLQLCWVMSRECLRGHRVAASLEE